LREQATKAVKQRADKGLFQVTHLRRGADVLGENAGQIGTQKVLFQLVGISLVLHMLEKQHCNSDVTHRFKTKYDDGPRNGADAAAAGWPKIG